MKLLLVEDDRQLAQTIKETLDKYFVTEIEFTGEEGDFSASVNNYDLLILDLNLPDISGIELTAKIRSNGNQVPILILTGQDNVKTKVRALDAGADDYLTKPFSTPELLARCRALLRRRLQTLTSSRLSVADLSLDLDSKDVKRGHEKIQLRRKELFLLEYLMRNAGRVVTREMILDHAWDSETEPVGNTVDVHIKYLRDHIDRPFAKKLIKTVHGLGYKLEG